MSKIQRHYTKEVKLKTVHLIEDSTETIRAIAAELSIPSSNVYEWYQAYCKRGDEAFSRSPRDHIEHKQTTHDAEISCLQQEIAHLTEERNTYYQALVLVSRLL